MVSKKIICNVVEICWGELAESTEILIPGIVDWANMGIPKEKNTIKKNKFLKNIILIREKICIKLKKLAFNQFIGLRNFFILLFLLRSQKIFYY